MKRKSLFNTSLLLSGFVLESVWKVVAQVPTSTDDEGISNELSHVDNHFLKENNLKLKTRQLRIFFFSIIICCLPFSCVYAQSRINIQTIMFRGAKYVGEVKNGKPNGCGIFYWRSGKKMEEGFFNEHGNLNGPGKSYWQNGNLELDGKWKDGRPYGFVKFYDINGVFLCSGDYESFVSNKRAVYLQYLSQRDTAKEESVKQSSNSGLLAGAALLGGAIYLLKKAFDGSSSSSSSGKSEESNPSSMARHSYSNVEIVSWGTYGSLAYSHASVTLRNKNNYDVDVTIQMHQGSWYDGKIIYENYGGSERIEGLQDEFRTTIRVKANSIRKVALRSDGGRGRPDYIRIKNVN